MLASTVRLPHVGRSTPIKVANQVEKYLVEPNCEWLSAYGGVIPPLLFSGIRYMPERDEEWLTIPYVIKRGGGDCEDLAAWLAAEDRVKLGYQSRVVLYPSLENLLHAVVARPIRAPMGYWKPWCLVSLSNYYIIDPSRALGMM